ERSPDDPAHHRDRSTGKLCGGESRHAADRSASSPVAPEQPRRELAPTGPSTRGDAAAVQELASRGTILLGVQCGLQPVSPRASCPLRLQLSDGNVPALAGMERDLGDDDVRGGSLTFGLWRGPRPFTGMSPDRATKLDNRRPRLGGLLNFYERAA